MTRLLRESDTVRSGLRYALTLCVVDVLLLALLGPGNPTVLGSFAVTIHLYFLDYDGSLRERAVGQCSAGIVGAGAVCLGTIVASPLWLALVATVIVSGLFAYARVLRGYVARAAVGLQGAFFLPLVAQPAPSDLPSLLAGWGIGSALAIIAALFLLPRRQHHRVRRSLGDWLTAAAALTRATVDGSALPARVTDLQSARDGLLDQLRESPIRPGALGRRQRALNEMVSRARWSMPIAHRLAPLQPDDDPRLALASARAFDDAAILVRGGDIPPSPPDIPRERADDLARVMHLPPADVRQHYGQRVISISAMTQLWLAGTSRGLRLPRPDVGSVDDESPVALLRSGLHRRSVWLSNAIRTGVGAAICVALADSLGIQHGLWVVLAALTCIQGTFSGPESLRRMVMIAAGSVIGVILASALLLPSIPAWLFILLLFIAAFIGKLCQARGALLSQVAYSPIMLFNLALLTWPPTGGLGIIRIEDVTLGACVAAILTIAVFPFGVRRLLASLEAVARSLSQVYLTDSIAAVDHGGTVPASQRQACQAAILSFEHALDAAYLSPRAADDRLSDHEREVALARDRLVGGDACAQLAAFRDRSPATAEIAIDFASWWSGALADEPSVNAGSDDVGT